jgi:hypothetical protein
VSTAKKKKIKGQKLEMRIKDEREKDKREG